MSHNLFFRQIYPDEKHKVRQVSRDKMNSKKYLTGLSKLAKQKHVYQLEIEIAVSPHTEKYH